MASASKEKQAIDKQALEERIFESSLTKDIASSTVQKSEAVKAAIKTAAKATIKKCPICKTTLFGDMDICYGCMYRFGSDPEIEARFASASGDTCAFEWAVPEIDMQKAPNAPASVPAASGTSMFGALNDGNSCLFNKFIVELHSFLGDFLADRSVHVD